MKIHTTDWGEILAKKTHILYEFLSRIYKDLSKIKFLKIKTPVWKIDKKFKQTLYQRIYAGGKLAQKKVLSTICC